MGIRFYCPNGHKLNVKSFLAGKRGICPHCGASVPIPLESTRPGGKAARLTDPASPGTPAASLSPDESPRLAQPAGPATAEPQRTTSAAPSTPPLPGSRSVDPIAESPDSIWYVRPAGGGQYGPAIGSVMRGWLEEGRVGPESLVWREGWKDWRPAQEAFPQLRGGEAMAVAGQPVASAPASTAPAAPARRRARGWILPVMSVMAVLLLILIGVLAWLVWQRDGGAEAAPEAASPEAAAPAADSAAPVP